MLWAKTGPLSTEKEKKFCASFYKSKPRKLANNFDTCGGEIPCPAISNTPLTKQNLKTMTTSAVLKKELKQVFPGIKFSVTTRKSSDNISVSWELTIGTTATNQAVSEICKRYETIEHHGNGMNDTGYYSGFSVCANPTNTQERKDWAVKATEAHNFVGTAWNETRQRFEESDGREAFHATKQYRKYCDNGVMSELLDEYGREPDSKRQYYKWLAKETQIETLKAEPKIVKPELVELPQEVISSNLIIKSPIAELVAPPKLATNLIAFPTSKQPEAQLVPQPQSQDSDYAQIYQKWVDKLVARGEYSKIKSYDEWYAIASEVM